MYDITVLKNRIELLELFKHILKNNYELYCDRLINELSLNELAIKYNLSLSCVTSKLYYSRKAIKNFVNYTNKVKTHLALLPKY